MPDGLWYEPKLGSLCQLMPGQPAEATVHRSEAIRDA